MTRREYLAAAKRRQRSRDRGAGAIVLTVRLSAEEAAIYRAALQLQRGPLEGFPNRCLTQGAMFLANMGTPRGGKLRAVLTCQQASQAGGGL